jgi:PAS domain S-box-containing protein
LVEPRRDADGNVVGVGGAALDITDRRLAEEGRLASEARLDMALQAGRMGAWEWDIGTGRIAWSPTLQAIHGLEPGTFGGTFEDFQRDMDPEDRPRVISEIRRALEEGGEYHLTYRITKPGGRRAWVEARAVVVRDADGRPVRMVGVCADVTERALAEAALRESEARFRAAAEGSRDSFFILKAARGEAGQIDDFEFVDMNARGSDLIGIPRERAIGGRLCELLPVNRDGFLDKYRRVVATGETLEEEFRWSAAGQGERWYWLQVVPLGDGIAITTADITQRKEAELNLERLVAQRTRELEETHARMRASERMAALGTLSAGLGHDMGNLLLPVRARLDAIERQALPPGLAEDIGAIRKSAEYLQRLSSGLRLLALDPEDSTASADTTALREWCADSTPVLKNILPRHVTLECDVPAGLPAARVPRHVLTQIVFNLVQNAGDAMRDRRSGRVRIHAAAGPGGAGWVELSISDDGPGMTAEVRRHCLEPFFTTKPRGISTGLGLALVNSAVQRMGGTIRIETAVGKGTTFVLGLPAGPESSGGRRPTAVVGIADPRIRSFVGTLLRSLSLDVVEQKGPGVDGAALWVTDAAGDLAAAAASPGWRDGERRVIVLCEAPAGDGVTVLGASPAPARLRQALSEAALACAGERGSRRGG